MDEGIGSDVERRKEYNAGMKALASDCTEEEAFEKLFDIQQHCEVLHGFNSSDLQLLASHLSVIRYTEGQTILQQGEAGSWFGVLLSGSLKVAITGLDIVVREGSMVGEMAMWQAGATRGATMVGKDEGYIGTMLVDELREFVHAQVGACTRVHLPPPPPPPPWLDARPPPPRSRTWAPR